MAAPRHPRHGEGPCLRIVSDSNDHGVRNAKSLDHFLRLLLCRPALAHSLGCGPSLCGGEGATPLFRLHRRGGGKTRCGQRIPWRPAPALHRSLQGFDGPVEFVPFSHQQGNDLFCSHLPGMVAPPCARRQTPSRPVSDNGPPSVTRWMFMDDRVFAVLFRNISAVVEELHPFTPATADIHRM
jgi:hypothetical protein